MYNVLIGSTYRSAQVCSVLDFPGILSHKFSSHPGTKCYPLTGDLASDSLHFSCNEKLGLSSRGCHVAVIAWITDMGRYYFSHVNAAKQVNDGGESDLSLI